MTALVLLCRNDVVIGFGRETEILRTTYYEFTIHASED